MTEEPTVQDAPNGTATLTLVLTRDELAAIKQALANSQGLTATGKVVTGMAELKVDEALKQG